MANLLNLITKYGIDGTLTVYGRGAVDPDTGRRAQTSTASTVRGVLNLSAGRPGDEPSGPAGIDYASRPSFTVRASDAPAWPPAAGLRPELEADGVTYRVIGRGPDLLGTRRLWLSEEGIA